MRRPTFPPTRPAARDVSRRAFLTSIALGATAVGLTGCTVVHGGAVAADQQGLRLNKDPAPGRARNIEIYNIWGGRTGNAWVAIAELYEQSQSHTGVRVTYAPGSGPAGDVQLRLQTAIAAGTPPDVAFVTPDQYPQLVGFGVVTELDHYLERAGLGASDYVPAVWQQMNATGHVYSMPGMVDVNFPLFWNKKVFAAAGLDPDVPPETIDDLERMSDTILQKSGSRITRIGAVPWNWYGYSNSLFTLGFAFGGKFMSDDNEVATPDDDNVVQALTWMCDYAKKVGGAGSLAITSPGQSLPDIATGHLGMAPMTATDAQNVYANGNPKTVELGSALFPYAAGLGSKGSATWLGGWNMFIPNKASDPDAAWDFVQFASASDAGTSENFAKQTAVSAMEHSPVMTKLAADPKLSVYRESLITCKNVRPTIPVAAAYASQLDVLVASAVFGQLTPKQALQKAASRINGEWDDFRKEHP